MRSKFFLFLIASLCSSCVSASAQNAGDIIDIFGGLVRSAQVQAIRAQWEKLPSKEIACVDQTLRQRGETLQSIILRGIAPTNPGIYDVRSSCRNRIGGPAQPASIDAPEGAPTIGDKNSPPRTYWSMDGSVVYLIVNGSDRKFYFQKPNQEMQDAGATPGSLIFSGKATNTPSYEGTVYVFNQPCERVQYKAAGPILDGYPGRNRSGRAPVELARRAQQEWQGSRDLYCRRIR